MALVPVVSAVGSLQQPCASAAFDSTSTRVAHEIVKVTGRQRGEEGEGEGEGVGIGPSLLYVFCSTCKLEVEGCSKGLGGQNKQRA